MKKRVLIFICALLLVLLLASGLFQISKSRTFQFFGGSTDSVTTDQNYITISPTVSPAVCPAAPPEYLMRSSCPYSSARVDGECRVVCPIAEGSNYNVSCKKDTDCDCMKFQTVYKQNNMTCRCAENRCVLVVDKASVKNWPNESDKQ